MGAHVHSIYRISPTDTRNVYVFVFAIPPWNDAYDWFEEKFVVVSKALGVEGLIVMADEDPYKTKFDAEIVEAYGKLDEQIRNLHSLGSFGLIVTNVNPHAVAASEKKVEDQVYFVPIRENQPEEITQIVSTIVTAAKTGDLYPVKQLSEEISSPDRKSLLRIFAESALLQPNFAGLGYDFGKLLTQLAERREHRRKIFRR